MNNKTIDKYLNEGLAKSDLDSVVYHFTNALDDIDDIFGTIESIFDAYIEKYGENKDLKKVFFKNSSTVNKALAHFDRVVITPMKKIYGK